MNNIAVTIFALSAVLLMSGCGSDGTIGGPSGNNASFSISTVTDGQHVLTGNHITACYGSPDGRIDQLNVTNTTWLNVSMIFAGDDTCSGIETAMGSITGFITKGAEKQTSGWRGEGDVAPQRADGTGSLSENETVTSFNLVITEIDDPSGIFGGVSVGFNTTAFYVFDDTAGGDTYIMYRDDDGAFASASSPYVAGSGAGSQLVFPVTAISGNEFELFATTWASGCYINGSIDSELFLTMLGLGAVEGIELESTQKTYLSNDGSCTTPTDTFTTTFNTVLDGTTEVITGWVDDFGGPASAPQKQDASGSLTDTETYTNMTGTVLSFTPNLAAFINVGDVNPVAYIVDDSTATTVLYGTSTSNEGNITAPLFLQ